MKVNWKAIGEGAKKVGGTIGYVLLLTSPYVLGARKDSKENYLEPANYSGAIRAILRSNMLDSYKKEAMSVIERDLDPGVYAAIIEVAHSNSTLDSYRIDMIRNLVK